MGGRQQKAEEEDETDQERQREAGPASGVRSSDSRESGEAAFLPDSASRGRVWLPSAALASSWALCWALCWGGSNRCPKCQWRPLVLPPMRCPRYATALHCTASMKSRVADFFLLVRGATLILYLLFIHFSQRFKLWLLFHRLQSRYSPSSNF